MSDTPNSVNTADLARELAQSDEGKAAGLSVAKSQDLILAFVNCVAGNLAKGHTVRVHNLGNFKVLPTKAREGKNPQTGEKIQIEAGKRVHLAVSQHLKDAATDGKVPTREPRKAPAKPANGGAKKPAAAKPAKAAPAAPAKTGGGFRPQGAAAPAAEAGTAPAADDI